MKYWFKPATHWHEITPEMFRTLHRAGYSSLYLGFGRAARNDDGTIVT